MRPDPPSPRHPKKRSTGRPARDGALLENDVDPDPFLQFDAWFRDAQASQVHEPEAMALATVDPDGQPAARMVLLKGYDAGGFTFFTNYESRKGRHLELNPRVALVFHWDLLQRQVRIEGVAQKVTPAESDQYFQSRPRGSRIAAAASLQSRPVASRAELHRVFDEWTARWEGAEIPRPPQWGGYRVAPSRIEFWQGRPDRLHDRIVYRLGPGGDWLRERLFP